MAPPAVCHSGQHWASLKPSCCSLATNSKKQLTKLLGEVKLPAPAFKLLVNHLAEQDDAAEVCKTKGEPEANPICGITKMCRWGRHP